MYSDVYKKYKDHGFINAEIPRKSVKLTVRTFYYKKIDLFLVLNIAAHSNKYDFLNNELEYEYEHAKAQYKEDYDGKRDSSKDITKKQCKNNDLKADDSQYGNNELEYDEDTLEQIDNSVEHREIMAEVQLTGFKIKSKQREQKGGKLNKEATDIEAPLTTKDAIGNDSEAVSKKESFDNNAKNKSHKITIDEIVKFVKSLEDFEVFNVRSFAYPKAFYDSGKEKNIEFIFVDKSKKIRRKCSIAHLSYKNVKFFIVELQPRYNGSTKSMLCVFLDIDDIDQLYVGYVKNELTDFAENKNRKWLSETPNIKDKDFFTMKHTGSINSFLEKLNNHYLGYCDTA